MKIGFYGNANNYPIMLARALRRLGHEVIFLVTSREALNRPECRYADISLPYPEWIHDVSHPRRWHALVPGPSRSRIQRLLNECDFAVLNEEGPALAGGLRIPYAVMLTGSDLLVFANAALSDSLLPGSLQSAGQLRTLLRHALNALVLVPLLVKPQRLGIRDARYVSYFAKGIVPEGDRLLAGMGVSDRHRIFIYMTDLELIESAPPPRNKRIRIFCGTRLTWKHEPNSGLTDLDYKGSDVMIRGLGLFWRTTGIALDIHLVRKGRHVRETLALATAENITEQITWHDPMTQHQVMTHFRDADIVFEQFASSVVGMAGLDAMAIGRPLIAHGRPEIFGPLIGEPSPICQAATPKEICEQLVRLVHNEAERLEIGRSGRAYVEKHFSSDAAARLCLRSLAAEANP